MPMNAKKSFKRNEIASLTVVWLLFLFGAANDVDLLVITAAAAAAVSFSFSFKNKIEGSVYR